MQLSYDKETDSLYIHLSNTPSVDSDIIFHLNLILKVITM